MGEDAISPRRSGRKKRGPKKQSMLADEVSAEYSSVADMEVTHSPVRPGGGPMARKKMKRNELSEYDAVVLNSPARLSQSADSFGDLLSPDARHLLSIAGDNGLQTQQPQYRPGNKANKAIRKKHPHHSYYNPYTVSGSRDGAPSTSPVQPPRYPSHLSSGPSSRPPPTLYRSDSFNRM